MTNAIGYLLDYAIVGLAFVGVFSFVRAVCFSVLGG